VYATDTRNIGNIWKIDRKIHRLGEGVGKGVSVYDILLYHINVYVHSIDSDGEPDRDTIRAAAAVAFFDKQLTRVSGHPVGRLPVAI